MSGDGGILDSSAVKRYWFLAALILTIPIGLMWPDFGHQVKANGNVIPIFVGVMLGIAGFTMDTTLLVKQAMNYRAVLPVLASTYLLAPTAAFGLAKLLGPADDPHFLPATMIMAAQAGSLASAIALTIMAGGSRELALICTLVSNALTVVLTPFILEQTITADYIKTFGAGDQITFPLGEMIGRMVLCVLLPIVIGQLMRPVLWERTEKIRGVVRVVPQFIILIFVYTGFAAATAKITNNPELAVRFMVLSVLLHIILLGGNALIGRALNLEWPERTAVILCGSQKTLPNGIYIWGAFFQANPYGAVPLVLYHLFQLIVDTLLVPFFEKRNPPPVEAEAPAGCHSGGVDKD